MITKEQAAQILVMASSYASRKSYNDTTYVVEGLLPASLEKHENDAWLKLKAFVEALTEE